MSKPSSREGTIPFKVAGYSEPLTTWYKVFGDLKNTTGPPIIALHGGPGATHEYIISLSAYASPPHNWPMIFYDQIGNGNSTHLPERICDGEFWTAELFNDQLNSVIDFFQLRQRGYYLVGQSWGGMLAAFHGSRRVRPKGLQKIVAANSQPRTALWEESIRALKKTLPVEVAKVLDDAEAAKKYEGEEYEKAMEVFNKNFFSLARPWPPKDLQACLAPMKSDPTVPLTVLGPSHLVITGSFKSWDIIPDLHRIDVPTLIISAKYDIASDICAKPFFDNIPKVKWVRLEESAHLSHTDDPERFNELVLQFLGP